MGREKKIRILIVDDSLLFREMLSRSIRKDPSLEVVAVAADPFDARDKILEFEPDLMICDVEMPKMNGIEFIRRLLPQYLLPVIVVSGVSNAVFDALNAGAVDFVAKPSRGNMDVFTAELIEKIKAGVKAKITLHKPVPIQSLCANNYLDAQKIIAIGASTGGTEALYNVLRCLPSQMPGMVIVQHIPQDFSKMLADRLNAQTPLRVREARNGDWVEPGLALLAPGNQHLTIKKIGGRYQARVAAGEKVNGHCPSVDVLFDSVAEEAASNAVGVILTGMGYDGAKGLLKMKKQGARTLGQDEASSVVYGMPKAAYDIGAVEKQLALDKIPQALLSLLREGKSR